MTKKIKVALVGCGNVGMAAIEAIKTSIDLELKGVVEIKEFCEKTKPPFLNDIKIVDDIEKLREVEVAILSVPTRNVPEIAEEMLKKGISTVDSFDIHGEELVELRKKLDEVGKKHNSTAVVSAGWDPGTDSIIRAIFEFMTPKGITYTNFGPGMSMGHTVAAKKTKGVKDAISLTIPKGTGLHSRLVYVEIEEGHSFENIKNEIINDPYFIDDETVVKQTNKASDLLSKGHSVKIERSGSTGMFCNQRLEFNMNINNPVLTATVMTASARAASKLDPGAYTLLEIPVIEMMPGDRFDIIERIV